MNQTVNSLCLKNGDMVTLNGKVIETDGIYTVTVEVESAADVRVEQRLFRTRDMVICTNEHLGVGQITDADDSKYEVQFLSGKIEYLSYSVLERATQEEIAAAHEAIKKAKLEAEQAAAFQQYMKSMSKQQVIDAMKVMQELPVMK